MNVRTRLLLPVLAIALVGAGCEQKPAPTPVTPPAPNTQETTSTKEAATPSSTPTATKPATTTPKPAPKPEPKPTTTPTPEPEARSYNTKFLSDAMILGVVVSDKGADLRWTLWSDRDFKGYVLVKSTTDQNPYYPKQSYFRFENREVGARFYQDQQMERGKTTYYRVCALDVDESVTCGPVASAKRQ